MKTSLDVVDEIFTALKGTTLVSAISGSVYKHKRALDSRLEDVIINSLPVNNEQLQEGIANVNIHVPDIAIGGANTDYQPNHIRLNQLAKLAIQNLDVNGSDYYFEVQQQTIIQEEASNEHFVNIRVKYFSINL